MTEVEKTVGIFQMTESIEEILTRKEPATNRIAAILRELGQEDLAVIAIWVRDQCRIGNNRIHQEYQPLMLELKPYIELRLAQLKDITIPLIEYPSKLGEEIKTMEAVLERIDYAAIDHPPKI